MRKRLFVIWGQKMTYQQYLHTPHWRAKRRAALEAAGYECAVCCRKEELQVHHRTYERLGDERIRDLIVFCRGCHALVGRHLGRKGQPARKWTADDWRKQNAALREAALGAVSPGSEWHGHARPGSVRHDSAEPG